MRSAAFLALGLLLIVAQGNLYPLVGQLGLHGVTPSLPSERQAQGSRSWS